MNKREQRALKHLATLSKEKVEANLIKDQGKLQRVLDNIEECKRDAANLGLTKEDCDNATDKYLRHQEIGDLIYKYNELKKIIQDRIDRSKKYLGL